MIVDYMQLMRADDPRMSRVEQVGSISRGLKLLASELEFRSSGSRSFRERPSSAPTSGRCSPTFANRGNLEQDSDVVCFIFRQEYYEPENQDVAGLAELIIAKHRNGPIGKVELAFQAPYPRFRNLAASHHRDGGPGNQRAAAATSSNRPTTRSGRGR